MAGCIRDGHVMYKCMHVVGSWKFIFLGHHQNPAYYLQCCRFLHLFIFFTKLIKSYINKINSSRNKNRIVFTKLLAATYIVRKPFLVSKAVRLYIYLRSVNYSSYNLIPPSITIITMHIDLTWLDTIPIPCIPKYILIFGPTITFFNDLHSPHFTYNFISVTPT